MFSAGLYLALILTVASGCKRNSDTYSSETGESGPVSQISCRNRNGAEDFRKNHRKAIGESERFCLVDYA